MNWFKGSLAVVGIGLMVSGCDGEAVVFSNAFAMGLTCFMLWSTLNLDRGA